MAQNGRPRRRQEAPRAPTTITEICRRYVATASALSKAMGLPLTEAFIREHRESITTCFIQAGMEGLRLPASVILPPLGATAPAAEALPDDTTAPPVNGTVAVDLPDGAPPLTGEAPLPTAIPREGDWPCGGKEIRHLTAAQLHLVLARAGFRAHGDPTVMPLLAAIQAERFRRLEHGRRTPRQAVAGEGDGHGA